jgi:hypothetical protein
MNLKRRPSATTRRGPPSGQGGQALPIAVAALALGALLVTPLLRGAGVGSRFTNTVGERAIERYSMDAGVEWSGWRLISDPRLTTDSSFTDAPLLPFPATVNGRPFPQTEIRYVPSAAGVEIQRPSWQAGGGDQCYMVSASEAGTLSARVDVDSGQVWVALLPAAASCAPPPGLNPLFGAAPYQADFDLPVAGDYQLLVSTDTATDGDIELSVPAATYEVRSVIDSRSVIARLVAGYSGVRVASWQLN